MEIFWIFFFLLVVIVIVIFGIWLNNSREKAIHEKIEAMGGKVDSIERRNFFTGIGPFNIVGKNGIV